ISEELSSKIDGFLAWKRQLVTDPNLLGGEPAFPKSRLAVRHIGMMILRGADPAELREDYPYLTSDDLEQSVLYTKAYPRVGGPREGRGGSGGGSASGCSPRDRPRS